ncbi:multicopper oxidase family protein [Kitasatospora sp. NPDC050543]|uniref:multicopper oxidase family protein n=1 Tax=Kitasatospora sp. NPDC050543 TaxID=3364054 RepID=UPI003792D447
MSRRQLLWAATAAVGVGAAAAGVRLSGSARPPAADPALPLPGHAGHSARSAQRAQDALDPAQVPKYLTPLVVLPAMPYRSAAGDRDEYEIAVRQFTQQILPPGMPATTVWGYGATDQPASFHCPAFTLEARADRPVRILLANQLYDEQRNFLPHLLPVDPTLHWANPPGGASGRDSRTTFTATPGPYRGPVPIVAHLHGGHSRAEADGYPEAWYLPDALDIPDGYARTGTFYGAFADLAASRGARWQPGTAVLEHANDQAASTLWFHDHALGLTRLNVYAGLCGFYLLRGGKLDLPPGVLPGPAPAPGDPAGMRYYEIPIMIHDRSFNRDGSLFYPDSRAYCGDVPKDGPFVPASDIPPIWNPETFGDTMVVNGRTWPVLDVEPRRYRLRLLNGSNARTLVLKIAADPLAERPVRPALPFWLIGADAGFLPVPVQLERLVLGMGERADVIVDFGSLPDGTELYLINEGPDESFAGGEPGADYTPADPNGTGQVMKFRLTPAVSADTSVAPGSLTLPALPPLGEHTVTRELSLSEMRAQSNRRAPVMAMLGTIRRDAQQRLQPNPLGWGAEVTENLVQHAVELWEVHNFTGDAHPVHIHQTAFQVVNRESFRGGTPRPPEAWESGRKDTVLAYPREITRIKVSFDLVGRFAWHCHNLDHEDNEMMRPIDVRLK